MTLDPLKPRPNGCPTRLNIYKKTTAAMGNKNTSVLDRNGSAVGEEGREERGMSGVRWHEFQKLGISSIAVLLLIGQNSSTYLDIPNELCRSTS